MLLRVKENELQYLKKEVQCLRDELQMMQKVSPGQLRCQRGGEPLDPAVPSSCDHLFCAGHSWPHQALPVPPTCRGQYSHLQTKKLRLRKGK